MCIIQIKDCNKNAGVQHLQQQSVYILSILIALKPFAERKSLSFCKKNEIESLYVDRYKCVTRTANQKDE